MDSFIKNCKILPPHPTYTKLALICYYKNFLSFILLILVFIQFVNAKKNSPKNVPKKNIPIWTTDEGRQNAFPPTEYISALGIGYSETEAKNKAVNSIASFIKTQVESTAKSKEIISQKNGIIEKTREVFQEIEISNNAELYALEYTAIWQNDETSEFYCVAFIERTECWNRLEPKLNTIKQNILQKYSIAKNQNDILLKLLNLYSIQKDQKEFQNIYDFANVIDAKKTSAYNEIASIFVTAQNECTKLKPMISISVKVKGDKDEIISRKIAALLENAGCTVTTGNTKYVAQAKCTIQIEEQNNVFTCHPGIQIDLHKTNSNETIVSYSKTCNKAADFDKDGTVRASYRSIENNLEKNFINETIFRK